MSRFFITIAAVAGAIAVGFGAFGAHYVKDLITPSRFDVYQTGIQYLMVHAVILFVAARMYREEPSRLAPIGGTGYISGWILLAIVVWRRG